MDVLLAVGLAIIGVLIVAGIVLAVTGHSLAEARKFVVALAFLAGSAAALFFSGYDPGFTEAVASLAGAVFAVIGVFAATNHSPDDLQKALEMAKGAVLSIVGFYTQVPAGIEVKVGVLIAAVVSFYAVYLTRNEADPLKT